MLTVRDSFVSDSKLCGDVNNNEINEEADTGIYNYDITKSTLSVDSNFVENDDSCLTTTITTNELGDSNSILSVSGTNSTGILPQYGSTSNDDKAEEQSAFDIQPLDVSNNVVNNTNFCKDSNNMGPIVSTKQCRRLSTANYDIGPRQLKYNQIGVYWKDKESRVYARFTWATRKYSKSFYVGPNKPYATVREAEKAAIRFLLINSPLHRRSHLKHFRFTESDDESNEPYVGTQALKEARKTKGIMLHFPAPESDDEVWSHYNTSNINPATLYGEIIKKMDNTSDNNTGLTSPITSARDYVTSKNKQIAQSLSEQSTSNITTSNDNLSSDEIFLSLMASQNDVERMVERQSTGVFMNPTTTATSISSKRFKPSKSDTVESSDTSYVSTPQYSPIFVDSSLGGGTLSNIDYNTLAALQHLQMTNYYLQQQMAFAAAAANFGMSSGAPNNTNSFIPTHLGIAQSTLPESKTELGPEIQNIDTNGMSSLNLSSKVPAMASLIEQHVKIPGQDMKIMPSSNISICSTSPTINYQQDYAAAAAMVAAATYPGWYPSPYAYGIPFIGTYSQFIPTIVPNAATCNIGCNQQNKNIMNNQVSIPPASHSNIESSVNIFDNIKENLEEDNKKVMTPND
ncbi:uncharacterized protein CMU_012820 [Cryptosporidium muris RN66]|uniref:Uncharacterized protein n=1 Tax=Cryptosporidium muris (strain RN66) TaxID=441375 RepID=B6AEJ1_CRYMR|nr:uncharacterized protein CMU_012820 [Cryptosporidium muris RN66]EEA06608.1 hypothetical protein, conserved [Cryptosporidium muris RN66]|eukprot:XP_002140957.1 hypothetical protein [Cryptosporidium muris RN66]